MNPDAWQRVQEVFQAALERDPDERSLFLEEACAGEDSIRDEVLKLLEADASAGSFIEAAVQAETVFLLEVREPFASGRRVGAYKIKQRIGEGGMSTVYLAVRADDQYQKRVALKIVKRGMDSDDILRRFRNERQILAGLDHPNIARLLDGGTTEDGLPYFVMEYIEGLPIDEYCDSHKLSTVHRLKLFSVVCHAVHFAHQNLVVHRDIKPGNILVTDEGVPKLLDFGIAKLLNPDLAGQTVELTLLGKGLMTPEYASPEQIRGRTITTASDVYSLGVLLYTLLTGRLPYRLQSRQPRELERLICETEPTRPSLTVIREDDIPSGEGTRRITPQLVGDSRGESAGRLRRRLSGDLDNIVLHSLRKDPQRRYASALQMAEDIRRHLRGRPILARRDTLAYRSSKFVRRNKTGVAIILLVLIFGVGMAFQSGRVVRERDRASSERDKAEQVASFLAGVFEFSDPYKMKDTTLTAREILDNGVRKIEKDLKGQPEVRAQLMETLGSVYQNLGAYDKSEALLKESLTLRKKTLGHEHPDVATSLDKLGVLARVMGNYNRADSLISASLAMRRRLLGPENLGVAESERDLGEVMLQQARYSAAESLLASALAIQRRQLPGEDARMPRTLNRLGTALYLQSKYDEAAPLLQEAVEMARHVMGEDHPEVATYLMNEGLQFIYKDDYRSAEGPIREALRIHRKVLGENHPSVGGDMINLAAILERIGKNDEAESLCRRGLAITQSTLGPDHPSVAAGRANLAMLLEKKGDLAGAELYYRGTLEITRKKLPKGHPDLSIPMIHLGMVLLKQGKLDEAHAILAEDLDLERRLEAERKADLEKNSRAGAPLPPGRTELNESACALGACCTAMGQYAEAESLLLGNYQAVLDAGDRPSVKKEQIFDWLIALYDAWRKPERAAEFRAKRTALVSSS